MWVAYYSQQPFGVERADLHAARICETIARSVGDKKLRLNDFLIVAPEKKELPPEQVYANARNLFLAMGAKHVKAGDDG